MFLADQSRCMQIGSRLPPFNWSRFQGHARSSSRGHTKFRKFLMLNFLKTVPDTGFVLTDVRKPHTGCRYSAGARVLEPWAFLFLFYFGGVAHGDGDRDPITRVWAEPRVGSRGREGRWSWKHFSSRAWNGQSKFSPFALFSAIHYNKIDHLVWCLPLPLTFLSLHDICVNSIRPAAWWTQRAVHMWTHGGLCYITISLAIVLSYVQAYISDVKSNFFISRSSLFLQPNSCLVFGSQCRSIWTWALKSAMINTILIGGVV